MPIRKQPGPQLPKKEKNPPTTISKEEDGDISDTESYFSSRYEPEYLTRLSQAVARRNRAVRTPFRHQIRPVKHEEVKHDGPGSPGTFSLLSSKSGETGFRYLTVEEDFERRPSRQATRRQRSNSEASDALPPIRPAPVRSPDVFQRRQNMIYGDQVDFDSDSDVDDDDSDSFKSLEAGFMRRRAQYDGQRCVSPSQRLRGFALRPSKSTVNISSPALANRLGVPMSAELEVWIDDLKK